MIPAVLHPKSRGYLKLKDNNPLSHPLIYPRYYTHPDDMKVMVEGIKFGVRLSETNGKVEWGQVEMMLEGFIVALRRYGFRLDSTPVEQCRHLQFGSDEYWECAAKWQTGPENHQAGSCKMGAETDPLAVVNPVLQVTLGFPK